MDYKSGRWLTKRQAILNRDKFRCRECRRFGILADASVVHHAYPADDYPEYAWCDWNLVSLCPGCHNAMHDRDSGALTVKGLAWLRRVSPPPPQNPEPLGGPKRAGSFPTAGKTAEGVTPRPAQKNAYTTRPQTTRAREGGRLWAGKL